MKGLCCLLLTVCLLFATLASADTIILRDGGSYSGECGLQTVAFTDGQGILYQFPAKDVQSLAFNASNDTVALRGGRSYSGHFTGSNPVAFQDVLGIKYQFPTTDIDAIVFNRVGSVPRPVSSTALVIPIGTDLPIRTNETIDSTKSYDGQTYSASINGDIQDAAGQVAIPAGSSAQLIVRKISPGGFMHSPELVLDLYSVSIGMKQYQVVSSDVAETTGGVLVSIGTPWKP
jgi:hypothetical protein